MPRPSIAMLAASAAALAAVLLAALPATAWSADVVTVVTQTVESMAPGAASVPGGFRFTVDDVAVSVLTDEAAGLLRVVARAGGLPDQEVRLIASALGPDSIPDLGARLVSVRGFVCAAVLAPLRGLTGGRLRRAVDGAVRMALEAAGTAWDEAVPRADVALGEAPAIPPASANLPPHAGPFSR